MAHDVSGAACVVAFGGEAGKAANRLGSYVFVRIRARDVAEDGDVIDPRDGRAPDARFRVLARQRAEGLALVGTEFIDRCGAHGRIRVLPARLRTKLLENAHVDGVAWV